MNSVGAIFYRFRRVLQAAHSPVGGSRSGRRRSIAVIAGLVPAIGSGTDSANLPLNRTASSGTDPRDRSQHDE